MEVTTSRLVSSLAAIKKVPSVLTVFIGPSLSLGFTIPEETCSRVFPVQ